jgi:hypothetical protein
MGLLKRLLVPKPVRRAGRKIGRATHPVRTLTSALTPKPVRNVKRAARKITHPIEAAELALEDATVQLVRGSGKGHRTADRSSEDSPGHPTEEIPPRPDVREAITQEAGVSDRGSRLARRQSGDTAATDRPRSLREENGADVTGFDLPFTLTDCDCGATRGVGAACRDCGAYDGRSDPHVGRRCRIVGAVRGRLDEQLPHAEPITPIDFFDSLSRWIGRYPPALQVAGDGDELEAIQHMGAALTDFRELQLRVDATSHHSSDEMVWLTIEGVLALLRSAISFQLSALTQPDPELALELAASGQGAIDQADEMILQTE